MQKSADAFRTISEVAEELDVPQHVLRFWESKFVQIKPLKRAGGRRYYRPDDVALLRGIRTLLYSDGYTIKGVQKVLKERGARHISAGSAPVAAAVEKPPVPVPPAPAAAPAARRRVAAAHPDEVPLPIFLPEFLKNPTPAAAPPPKPAKTQEPPSIPPAKRKKLEKILTELTAIKGLLAGE